MSRECGPVIEVIEPDEYGGVKIVFGGKAAAEWRCVRLTAQHWEAIQNWCSKQSLKIAESLGPAESVDPRPGEVSMPANDFEQLLAVATLYVESFKDDELMSLTEKLRLQGIEDILARHGKRY